MTDGCAAQIAAGALDPGRVELGARHDARRSRASPPSCSATRAAPSTRTATPTAAGCPAARPASAPASSPPEFGGRDLDGARRAGRRARAARAWSPTRSSRAASGSRSLAPDAEGFLLGTPVDEADRYAALLQGVAYVERLCFDYLELLGAPDRRPLTLTGGGARSRYWCQLRADVLGRPVRIPRTPRPAFGMAVLAAAGASGRPLAEHRRARWSASREEHRAARRRAHASVPRAVRAFRRRARKPAAGSTPAVAEHTPQEGRGVTRIVLVRHGETAWHAENRYAGRSDVALTPRGREQAERLGRVGGRRRAGGRSGARR